MGLFSNIYDDLLMYVAKGFLLGHHVLCSYIICVVSDLVLGLRVHVDVGIHLLSEFCNHFSPLFLYIFFHACLVAMV